MSWLSQGAMLKCLVFFVAICFTAVRGQKNTVVLATYNLPPYIEVGENCMHKICPLANQPSPDTVFFGPLNNLATHSPMVDALVDVHAYGTIDQAEAAEAVRSGTVNLALPINDGRFVPHNQSIDSFNFIQQPLVVVWHPGKIIDPFSLVLGALWDTWPYFIALFIGCSWAGFVMHKIDSSSDYDGANTLERTWKGFWWAFVTATTVGYGDKTARTLEARLFAIMWIVAGVVLVAMLTGTFTNTLTSYGLMVPWDWLQQAGGTIGALQYTTAELVAELGANPVVVFSNHTALCQALETRDVDAALLDFALATHCLEVLHGNKLNAHEIASMIGAKEQYMVYYNKDGSEAQRVLLELLAYIGRHPSKEALGISGTTHFRPPAVAAPFTLDNTHALGLSLIVLVVLTGIALLMVLASFGYKRYTGQTEPRTAEFRAAEAHKLEKLPAAVSK